ncbi:BTAD domain-containing putative transcriptional regulator [Streptomyces sp. NPDC048018]|uniref:BTAD domain-containing putative transcriptional regulator n=1 Tax=Streptomyces sp. NPDC048018 TaxID=3365499 RepID=UPI00371AB57C
MIFRLLGPLTVADAPAAGGPRARALLALLLLDAGRTVGAERIVDGLYGDEPPAGAANALQSQVSRLRRVLPAGVGVEHSPAGYRLTGAGPDEVDALRFERLAREGARAGAAGDPAGAEGLLREALALWRGPALADVRDAPYARGQAARLDALRIDALEEWAAARLASGGDPVPLVRELAEATTAHPLRERLRALQIRALAGAGRQAEALAVYEEVRGALADELGADPAHELAEAHLAVLRGEPSGAAAVRPAPVAGSRPVRPPVPLTGFVGREGERERLAALLTAARLVTLVGPGGAGKTRLAVEAVADGAVFVDLGSVGPGEVAGAFARALGVRDAAPDRLVQALADRPVLLVADNCEHVVTEAAVLVRELLAGCPQLRVLATSREALGITGESLLPLAALAPRAAEELFVRRGAAARPGFTGHARVAEICAALDGLPLALELAAARLRTLTADELADRLGDRFRLLSRGDRTAPERHRTLAAVVEWSWELLTEEERTLAARLSVFRGGATPESVARVCGLDPGDAEDLLVSLTEKSLVERLPAGTERAAGTATGGTPAIRTSAMGTSALGTPAIRTSAMGTTPVRRPTVTPATAGAGAAGPEAGGAAAPGATPVDGAVREAREREVAADGPGVRGADGPGVGDGRYRMLETVRAYAAGRLPAADPAHAAHTAHYLGLARAADPELRGAAQSVWLARLDAEEPNLRAALRRAAPEDGLRLVAALTPYWWLRGLRGQVAGLAAELLDAVERAGLAGVRHLGEEYALCVLAAGARDEERIARARTLLTGRTEPLRQPFTAFLWATAVGPEARLPVPDDTWSRALDLVGQGHLALARDDAATAREHLTKALTAFRALGERWGTATALEGLAALSDDPLPLFAEALALFESLGVAEDIVDLLGRRAAVRTAAGDADAAAADLARAREVARRAGLPDPVDSPASTEPVDPANPADLLDRATPVDPADSANPAV